MPFPLSQFTTSSQSKLERPWLVLVGPTSVGKTKIAERIAAQLKTDLLVADSRQVYQGMDIGTNKPTPTEQQSIKRELIDLVSPGVAFTAGAYRQAAESVIARLEAMEKAIVIEGGTGLYIKALLYGLWGGPPGEIAFRQTLFMLEQKEGAGTLHRKLTEVDPESAAQIHFRDLSKIARALEVFQITGRPLSAIHAEHKQTANRPHPFVMIGFRRERSDLYARIEARIDQQFNEGLVAETKRLLDEGCLPATSSMRALGYKQVLAHLRGERTLEETISLVKRETRHYAKRQMTWFSAAPTIEWIDLRLDETADETLDRIKNLHCCKGVV
jgi:tRNA dimethylallyltransferase